MDVREAVKKQNEVAMFLSWHLFSTVAKRSNSVFSPASINAAFTMMASGPGGSSLIADKILSFLRSSSIDELNSVFHAEELRMEVNAWALHYTNGFIKDLLPLGSVL